MFGSKKNKEPSMPALNQPVDTLISQHCVIEGNLITQNSIKLDGRVHGNLLAKGHVIVGESGVVQGDIQSTDLLVFGRIDGNVRAQSVQLKATAHILGNIETEIFQVDPGAHYQGGVSMGKAGALPALPDGSGEAA